MLFQTYRDKFVDRINGERIHFVGSTKLPIFKDKLMVLIGVKTPSQMIRTTLLYRNQTTEGNPSEEHVQFQKELKPADFERFLNNTAMKIATDNPENKLVELEVGAAFHEVPEISKEEHEILNTMFMTMLAMIEDRDETIHVLKSIIDEAKNSNGTMKLAGFSIAKVQAENCRDCDDTSCMMHPSHNNKYIN